MIRTILILGLVFGAVAHGHERDVPCPPELAKAREEIVDAVDKGLTPGVSAVIVKNGRVIWAEGFGFANIERKIPAHSDTIYLQASVSKPLTATGLMILVDKGKIDLDKPANAYLPGEKLRAYLGNADDMTVRRLANHTSGMPTHYNFFYDGVAPPSMDETIRRYGFASMPPGTEWNYSNLAFGVLNYVTEVVGGQPWGAFMEEHLYDPLGMLGTSDHVRAERFSDAAEIYTHNAGQQFVPVAHYEFDHPGASAIWASAHDLARFCQMHVNGGDLDGVRVLSPEAAREMITVRHETDTEGYGTGVGWGVGVDREHRFISHGGGMPGVRTQMRAYPDDSLVIIVLSNSDTNNVVSSVMTLVAETILGLDKKKSAKTPDEQKPDAKEFQGKWKGRIAHFNGDIPLTLTIKDAETVLAVFGRSGSTKLDNPVFGKSLAGTTGEIHIPVQDGFHGRVEGSFNLRLTPPNRLTGTLFASASGYFGVSFWVDLSRAK